MRTKTERLETLAEAIAALAEGNPCDAGNPDGGHPSTCDHCGILVLAKEARELAGLPEDATRSFEAPQDEESEAPWDWNGEGDPKPPEMIVGRRYQVRIEDCCVNGSLSGTLLKLVQTETDLKLTFDSGRLSTHSFKPYRELKPLAAAPASSEDARGI